MGFRGLLLAATILGFATAANAQLINGPGGAALTPTGDASNTTVVASGITQTSAAWDAFIPLLASDGNTQLVGGDGALSVVINNLPSSIQAYEIPHLIPGVTGAGGTLLCQHQSDPLSTLSADCNVIASNEGHIRFGGGDGLYAEVLPPGAPVTNEFQIVPGTNSNNNTVTIQSVSPSGSTANLSIIPGANNGGVAIGQNSISQQTGSTALGLNVYIYGSKQSLYSGHYGFDFSGAGPLGGRCHMSSIIPSDGYAYGGNQLCEQTLAVTMNGTSGARMTVDGTTTINGPASIPIQPNGHGTFSADVECSNATSGDSATWLVKGTFSRLVSATRLIYLTGAGTSLSGSTSAGGMGTMSLAVAADTTNNNISFIPTPPSGNSVSIDCTAIARWMQRIS